MNTYTITATREDGTTFSNHVTAPTPGEARKDFKDIYRHGKPYTITSVDVYKENVSATKDQERKAVEQIRAILDTLGPNSYTASALEGYLEIAEQNIENDFADSWKDRCECAGREAESLRQKIAELEKELKTKELDERDLRMAISREKEEASRTITALQKQVLSEDDMTDICNLLWDREAEDEEAMSRAADDIVKYAEGPTSKEFANAVHIHRHYAKSVEYFRSLRHRVESAEAAHHAGA